MIVQNYWHTFYAANHDLLPEHIKRESSNYLRFEKTQAEPDFDYIFCLDGSSDRVLNLITTAMESIDNLVVLKDIKPNSRILFLNYGEGYSNDELFNSIHRTILLNNLTGYIEYQNCAVNNQEMYDIYCTKNQVPKLINKCSYKNVGFLEDGSRRMYDKPAVFINELLFEEKKLFNSYNWNAWRHRLALIAMLHYNDLIDYGYITSPGINKYEYNPKSDFEMLYREASYFFEGYEFKNNILQKLTNLESNYPLKIDDRTKVNNNTDYACYDLVMKAPLYECRVNSLFEIITETKFSGEHFFSEKTYTPISMKRPFIMVNGSRSLASLRKIGFKTFSPIIDESYDDDTDDISRMIKIVNEIKKWNQLRLSDPLLFREKYESMNSILEYNYQVFMSYRK
jgi:hypothetical protein